MYYLLLFLAAFGSFTDAKTNVTGFPKTAIDNDRLLNGFKFFNKYIVSTLSDNDDEIKVQFTLYATVALYYINDVAQNLSRTEYDAITTVSQMRNTMTPDALASEVTNQIDYIKTFVNLPISDVKGSCVNNVTESQCIKSLNDTSAFWEEHICSDYDNHMALHRLAMQLAADEKMVDFVTDLVTILSSSDDIRTYNLFVNNVAYYSGIYKLMAEIQNFVSTTSLNCKSLFGLVM